MPLHFKPVKAIKDILSRVFKPKAKTQAPVVICRECHRSFMPPLLLPVMSCPWCGCPNFS